MIVPSDVGRVPYKIVSGFSSFTADQFKNWIVLFSLPTLYGILPNEHLQCWQKFVLACRILCKGRLSQDDIILFDVLLLQFCQCAQSLYGEQFITHACPSEECRRRLWASFRVLAFSFERYNGILGSQSNNHRDIESQLLNRFLRDNFVYSFEFPAEFSEDFKSVCSVEESMVGSLHDTAMSDMMPSDLWETASHSRRGVLDSDDSTFLLQLYKKLRPDASSCTIVNSMYV